MAVRLSPALVRGFDYAAAGDGTHFEITDENGAALPYEIDTWNPDGESLLWVKVPLSWTASACPSSTDAPQRT